MNNINKQKTKINNPKLEKVIDNMMTIKEEDIKSIIIRIIMKEEIMEIDHIEEINHIIEIDNNKDQNGKKK
jgi:predicted AlkP superfamily phosphohydrolase/phosphomutase